MRVFEAAYSYTQNAKKKTLRGFAMAELIIVFVVMGVAAMLASGLMSQVLKVGQRSAQTGAILELRNRVNIISKNPGPWLERMRAKHAVYSACIPDSNAATFSSNVFKCPDVANSDKLKDKDSALGKVAGSQLHISSAPIVDYLGEAIAGTEEEPLYLDSSGRVCDDPASSSKCPFKSTGYLMRTNPSGDQNPGEVRFVVKVEKNIASLANANTGLFKPEYLSIELGQTWMDSKAGGAGTLKVGYRLDGNPLYVKAGLSCSGTQVLTGIGMDGKAECKSVPIGCLSGKGMMDPLSSELVCSQSEECGAGQIFLGHFAGTGEAICSSATMSCQADQVQVGVKQTGASLVADCKALPSCSDSQKISYDGSQFQCVADILSKKCPTNQVMVGTNDDGTLNCADADRSIASDDLTCDEGYYVFGIKKDGSVRCKLLPAPPAPVVPEPVVAPPPPTIPSKKITFEISIGGMQTYDTAKRAFVNKDWQVVKTFSEIFVKSQDVWIGAASDWGTWENVCHLSGTKSVNFSKEFYKECSVVGYYRAGGLEAYGNFRAGYFINASPNSAWVKVDSASAEVVSALTMYQFSKTAIKVKVLSIEDLNQ